MAVPALLAIRNGYERLLTGEPQHQYGWTSDQNAAKPVILLVLGGNAIPNNDLAYLPAWSGSPDAAADGETYGHGGGSAGRPAATNRFV